MLAVNTRNPLLVTNLCLFLGTLLVVVVIVVIVVVVVDDDDVLVVVAVAVVVVVGNVVVVIIVVTVVVLVVTGAGGEVVVIVVSGEMVVVVVDDEVVVDVLILDLLVCDVVNGGSVDAFFLWPVPISLNREALSETILSFKTGNKMSEGSIMLSWIISGLSWISSLLS